MLSAQPYFDLLRRTEDSSPGGFTAFDGQVVFAATGSQGNEPYITDGTPQGTRLLKDINPGINSSTPQKFFYWNGRVYFQARRPDVGTELWSTDGTTAGTNLVCDLIPGPSGASIDSFTALNDRLFFSENNQLWRTDGTTAGTEVVATNVSNVAPTVLGNEVLFVSTDSATGQEIRAIGAAGASRTVTALAPGTAFSNVSTVISAGTVAFFIGDDGSGDYLYVTDGTTGGTTQLAPTSNDQSQAAGQLVAAENGCAFFTAPVDSSFSLSLFYSNGTRGGTVRLPYTFDNLNGPLQGGMLNNELLFGGTDDGGTELFRSNGTSAGTSVLVNLTSRVVPGYPNNFRAVGGKVYFESITDNGRSWVTDGTIIGTHINSDPYPPGAPTTLNGKRIIAGYSDFTGGEPAAGDPQTGEETILEDINTAPASARVGTFMSARAFALLNADGELWRTDGSASGTWSLGEIDHLTDLKLGADGRVYFVAGSSFYVTDGTRAGTQLLSTFSGNATALKILGNRFLILAQDSNWKLYASDGTTNPPTLVATLDAGPSASLSDAANGRVFVSVYNGQFSRMWQSDGTVTGTSQLEFLPVSSSSGYSPLGTIGTAALFAVVNELSGGVFSIYRTDGTQAGSYTVAQAYASTLFNGHVYFLSSGGLYRSDGMLGNTTRIADIPGPAVLFSAAAMDDALYFIASADGSSNPALWKTDGVSQTSEVLSLGPLTVLGGEARSLTTANDRLYLASNGHVLSSDGTAGGTVIEVGASASAFNAERAVVGDAVVTYDDATAGTPLVRLSSASRGAISGEVFEDSNSNGIFDAGESPLVGRTVFIDSNENGLLDADEASQVSDTSGHYRFGALLPGDYPVDEVLPSGAVKTTAGGAIFVASGETVSFDLGSRTPDVTAPAVLRQRSIEQVSGQLIELRLSEDIGAINASQISLLNVVTGETLSIDPSDVSFDNDWNRVTVSLHPQNLPDGNYRLVFAASSIEDLAGNSLAQSVGYDFFVLAGDANANRQVEITDFNVLASNFGKTGLTFSQGNFDYSADGSVTILDFNVLAAHFGKHLDPPATATESTTGVGAVAIESSNTAEPTMSDLRNDRPILLADAGLV